MKVITSLLALVALATAVPQGRTQPSSSPLETFRIRAVDFPPSSQMARRSPDVIASNHMAIRRIPARSSGTSWLRALHRSLHNDEVATEDRNSTTLTYLDGLQYVGSLKVGSDEYQVTVDTGSADTWLIQANFTCLDFLYNSQPREYCNFGKTYNGTFQYGAVGDVANFSINYADQTFVRGQFGYEDVTVAGVTVKKQQMSLVDIAYFDGGGISGLMGLAYPMLTRAFTGNSRPQNSPGSPTHRKYDPVFTNMHKQGLVSPIFSMAMDRTGKNNGTGWLSFGGLPPVDYVPEFGRTPIRMVEVQNIPSLATDYSFYTIVPDMFIYGDRNSSNLTIPKGPWNNLFTDAKNASRFPVIVDSGTSLVYLPSEIAAAYAIQFPEVESNYDQYWAPCNTKVPKFGVVIGGKTFYFNEEDLLQKRRPLEADNGQLYCIIGIADGYSGPYLLGDVFMNNVVSVFDVGAGEMRFAQRK